MVEITEHDKFYWKYEYEIVSKYLLPLLEQWGVKSSGAKVLDVGCGDGGGLAALHDAGMSCKGYDSEELRKIIRERSSIPIIPRKSNSKTGNADMAWDLYKFRHLMENVFARLKHFR